MRQEPPNLQSYLDSRPVKTRWWSRRWLQLTTASLIAFTFGIALGGSPSTDNMMSLQKAHTLADQAAKDARAEAVADVKRDVMSDPQVLAALDSAREEAQTDLDQAQTKAQRQAKRLASAQAQIRTLKQQKTAALAAATNAKRAAADAKAAAAAAPAASQPEPAADSGTDPRFSYCYEANDAGYGPYFQGEDPEYDWYDDRDGDGEVCE